MPNTTDKIDDGEQQINSNIMFFLSTDYWFIVIILTLIAAFTLDKKINKDARFKSGHRKTVDYSKGFVTRLREGFIGAIIVTTIGYIIYYALRD